ncbi:MAG: hypothetical protein LBH43_10035 [Treponema sp.]|nr:hypothetical protein [Treponema sp.]
MESGEISGNTASGNNGNNNGGGVHVGNGGTFTMSGGGISGNSTSSANNGGGVYVGSGGTFTMSGGGISGNTSSRFGGGVYVNYSSGNYGIFTKTGGGTVYGYSDESSANRNESNNGGHAVYVYSGAKRRETTAGPGVNLDSGVSGAAGGWEN